MKLLILYSVFILFHTILMGSSATTDSPFDFEAAELELLATFTELFEWPSQSANTRFITEFAEVLSQEGAFYYPFDSLVNVGRVVSPDGLIRVFTWNLPLAVGYSKHSGFIMVKHNKKVGLFHLNDRREEVEEAFTEILSPQKWYGSLYYHIHQEEYAGSKYYTLLGVSFKDLFSTQRIIEPLRIDHQGKPVFGIPIFSVRGRKISRVVLEYSARVNVMLKYSEEMGMIVFDHLVPSRPQFQGVFSHYGPDMSHDGFRFQAGEWLFEQNIDLRDHNVRRRPEPVEAPEENPEPGFLYRRNY